MSKGIRDAHEGARGIEGLLHYRLVGEGARDPYDEDKPTLTPQEKRKAEAAWKEMKKLVTVLDDTSRAIFKVRGTIKDLDRFMHYT